MNLSDLTGNKPFSFGAYPHRVQEFFTTAVWGQFFPSVLWHCWLGDRKGIRPVRSWMLVCWWWWFDWSFARLIAPVVTTTSIILCFTKHRLTQFHLENGHQMDREIVVCCYIIICVDSLTAKIPSVLWHCWLGDRKDILSGRCGQEQIETTALSIIL